MPKSEAALIWIDLEMTGLNTREDHIIEMAAIITDAQLNIIAEGPVIAIYQPESVLEKMDNWNQRQHKESGLLMRVRSSEYSAAEAEEKMLSFLKSHIAAGKSPMCGNSICQDRRFLAREMPTLEAYFHYRNLDVSSIKILAQLWAPEIHAGLNKSSTHQALEDVKDSIAELRYYREKLLRMS